MSKLNQINNTPTILNRRAEYEYFLLEVFEAGLVLTGTEIKSVRHGKVQMQDAYCLFDKHELYIRNLHISPYEFGGFENHDPKRTRKLLLTKQELRKLKRKLEEKGLTIIPTKIYFSDRNFAKIEIALAKGKKSFDKRQTLKEKDVKKQIRKEID